ncbi:HK97 family phage prohead protease [Salipiger manganoxidans]|uniref:Prohead serine protease domain-containing protein n=1 Tax=Salipiger marinus TaxID=555512 RepID=A0A1G8PUL6_9RHOB|nr:MULTISPECIES: HK97 family phage prohead protease [Salipiger]MCD1620748.1 HK97 family phage prohead protease [Salipiger manganoxidans]SDI95956.1 prohead peptidase. Unknown type peptidase. MEROPS family U35 [Salipiger marinus]
MEAMHKVASPVLEIKALKETGEFEGYGSTFGGDPDVYGDVIAPGAFTESLEEHRSRGTMPKMFWQHDSSRPIGKWLEASEDARGLLMRGKLNMAVQQAKEAYALLKEGDIDGLSIGYRIREYSVDTDTQVWTLEKLDLREVSVVSIGANENATVASVKAAKAHHDLSEMLKAGDRLTERQFELWLKGLGFSNAQAERAARLHLKGQGEPADADQGLAFLRALSA